MRFLKILLWVILILLGIYLVLCATGSKDMNTSKSATINAPVENVFAQLSDFNMFKNWSAWNKRDPNMQSTITGNPGEVGHASEWVSESQGSGRQWIAEIRPNEFIKNGLTFKDWPDTSYGTFVLEPKGDSTTVTWTMEGSEIPFLLRGMMTVFGAKAALEKDFTEGLTNLAAIAEAMPKTPAVAFEVIDIPDTWYVGKMFKGMSASGVTSDIYSSSYEEIGKYLGSMKAAPAGAPLSIAHNFNEATYSMDLEIALPTATEIPATAALTSGKIPAGKAAKFDYMGGYSQIGDAWGKFMAALSVKHKPRWSSYEVYVTDPGSEPDSTKWVTHLICPIE